MIKSLDSSGYYDQKRHLNGSGPEPNDSEIQSNGLKTRAFAPPSSQI